MGFYLSDLFVNKYQVKPLAYNLELTDERKQFNEDMGDITVLSKNWNVHTWTCHTYLTSVHGDRAMD